MPQLTDVRITYNPLFWIRLHARNALTLTGLEQFCEWLREQVLKADRENTPETWQTPFDFFRAFRKDYICLCIAASIGVECLLNRKVMKAEFEVLFAKSQMRGEVIADVDEDNLRREGLRQLWGKLCEVAENPLLLSTETLL